MSEFDCALYLTHGEREELPFEVPTDLQKEQARIPHVNVNDVGDGDELELTVWAVRASFEDLYVHRAVYDGFPAEGMSLMAWNFTRLDADARETGRDYVNQHAIETLAYIERFLLSYNLELLRTIAPGWGPTYTRHPDDADPDIGPEGVTTDE